VYRFAPSPTGFLHVGGARTAVFNWLLARQSKGKFLLRIEDTDRERSTPRSIGQIFSSLQWLGLDWDGEAVFQSARRDRHIEVANHLLKEGKAYRCFCSREELEKKRKQAELLKINQRYDGACRHLSSDEIDSKLAQQLPYSIRLKVTEGEVAYDDVIHGPTCVQTDTLDDFIILRSDGTPIYQLAVVVDDHDMSVTRIMRGDDHIANTPKQILIYNAMGWPTPRFGHLPLILGADKNRLSKRHGAASVEDFREAGILSEALFNYLCLLGWSPGTDQEVFSREELIHLFDEKKINNRPAVFDQKKLLWVNGKHIGNLTGEEIIRLANQWLADNNYVLPEADRERFYLLAGLAKNRAQTLNELTAALDVFFTDPVEYDAVGLKKHLTDANTVSVLEFFNARLSQAPDEVLKDAAGIELFLRNFADEHHVSASQIIHPLRLALTGKTAGPGIFETVYILGREKVAQRLFNITSYIKEFNN
jgi:glutamyl-tRNA synthetase